jgi:Cytochrome P460
MQMKKLFVLVFTVLLAGGAALLASHAQTTPNSAASPQFTADGKLIRPEGYRRWVYVSSGFGMSYNANAGGNGAPAFTNVFVTPGAYDYFLQNGKWPDKTMFVLEIYSSTSHGSINKSGSYQQTFQGLDVEVKDEARFADKWAYFGFDGEEKAASATKPSRNDCWKCHDANAAVEHSFVQFYPELLKVAREKGTIKPGLHLE